jgi:hypothetical protein
MVKGGREGRGSERKTMARLTKDKVGIVQSLGQGLTEELS